MKKCFIIALFLALCATQSAFAQKIPIRITPAQIISTNHDEVEVGDWIKFSTINDVFIDDKLYVKAGSDIWGLVDFYQPNGWVQDNAEIGIKTFETRDANNNKVVIDFPISLTQNLMCKGNLKELAKYEIKTVIRGSELYIEPDETYVNLFIKR